MPNNAVRAVVNEGVPPTIHLISFSLLSFVHIFFSDTMALSPRRSPRQHVLTDRTNLSLTEPNSPTTDLKGKRRADVIESPKKRKKYEEEEEPAGMEDVVMADAPSLSVFPRVQRHDFRGALRALRWGDARSRRYLPSE